MSNRIGWMSVLVCGVAAAFSGPAAAQGLFGEYFSGISLVDLVFTRVDETVDFEWEEGAPGSGIGADNFSVRWTGTVEATYSEVYTFYTTSDDGIRLWFDGDLVINHWSNHSPTEDSYETPAALTAGQTYDIKVEYYEYGGGATAQLRWESASQTKGIIPSSALTPGTGEGEAPYYADGDWHRNPANGHYYKRSTQALSWPDAAAEAAWLGGYLVTIDDAEENSWVWYTLVSGWIGGNDIETEGTWEWVEDGTDFFVGDYESGAVVPGMFANWSTNEPNDSNDAEDYSEMRAADGRWNDLGATYTRSGIIECESPRINYSGPEDCLWVEEGGAHTFSVEVRPYGGAETYAWKKEGDETVLSTNTSLTIDPCTLADAGFYYCSITDVYTTEDTHSAYLNVVPEGALPVTGGLGLALMAAACGLAGARIMRRER